MFKIKHLSEKTKEFTYNYVDRIRLAEGSLQDHNYPVRGSGWRHKSVSHLDLATSCHSAASGLNHWPAQRQLRPSRSLDYNHINRCKDALDIAEYYWRIDPEEQQPHYEDQLQQQGGGQKSGLHSRCQYKEALYRDYADETYHSTNSIYSPQQQQQQQQQSPQQQQQIQPFDVGNDTCSLRRSRSLAVIREETFSDLQITSTNSGRRRSQLIPRARLVNRGFFREHETRFNCANNKHHHHHGSREKLTNSTEQDAHSSTGSGAGTCDSHQHQHPQSQHHHHHHHSQHQQPQQHQSREADDYYDNLKRLDASAGIAAAGEHLHPWHNDKSDLESLNSDYFKNSLHQSNELKQQQLQLQQQQQQQLEKEAVEQSTLLRSDKPRIYQSRRQQRTLVEKHNVQQQQQPKSVDSCPENSQSSAFPETTTSNSDDQTDSLSLSEQEYDLTRIEEIFQQSQLEQDDEESYELISLTTTTRTRFETTEEETDDNDSKECAKSNEHTTTDTEIEGTLKRARALSENLEKLIAYDSVYLSSEEGSESTLIEEHNGVFTQPVKTIEVNKQENTRTTTTLLHISIEDTVFDSPLHSCGEHQVEDDITEESEEEKQEKECVDEKDHENQEVAVFKQADKKVSIAEPPLYTQILKVEHSVAPSPIAAPTVSHLINATSASNLINTSTPINTYSAATKPRILAVVEKRKLKRAADCLHEAAAAQRAKSEQTPLLQSQQHHINNCLTGHEPFKANLIDNQYHSLPDVNIGKCLKVSERIDAKLRSSYNLNKYQTSEKEVSDCGAREGKSSTRELRGVTTAEIYDSIKRFGQAHQKARLREYQELHDETIVREKTELREQKQETEDKQSKNVKYVKEVQVIEQQHEQVCIDTDEHSSSEREEKCTKEEHIKTVCETTVREYSAEQETSEVKELNFETEVWQQQQVFHAKDLQSAETKFTESLLENTSEAEQIIDANEYLEQPKEAPSIEVPHFTREIERRAKEIKQIAAESKAKKKRQRQEAEIESQTFTSATFRINKSTNNFPQSTICASVNEATKIANQFRIIVTDAQNNIIEEDSITGQSEESSLSPLTKKKEPKHEGKRQQQQQKPEQQQQLQLEHGLVVDKVAQIKPNQQSNISFAKHREKEKSTIVSHNRITSTSLKRVPSKPKRQQISCQQQQQHNNNNSNNNNNCETSSPKSKDRRVLCTQIYKARPAKVLTANESFRRAGISSKMSRPQILHIVDNKRNADIGTAEGTGSAIINSLKQFEGNQVENEYMKKVDAVRCYWSKLAKNETEMEQQQQQQVTQESHSQPPVLASNGVAHQQQQPSQQQRHFHLGAPHEGTRAKNLNESSIRKQDEFCSFMPSIEIVELDGDKKATIVSTVSPHATDDTLSNAAREPQFDHIRYKVMKSQQLLRSNVLARNKKEAQFDGLIQYLQDYSFQELLSNNNVVIVEPVRTKIERPTKANGMPNANDAKLAQSTNSIRAEACNKKSYNNGEEAALTNGEHPVGSKQSSAIKRHFFYQPVRVNRELYEEELPNPDTVRNVRKFFEKHILPTPGRGIRVAESVRQHEVAQEYPQLSPRSRRARKYRYLTIDTSYGHAGLVASHQQAARKWDSASLSSGISSGDLSSPCECNEMDASGTTAPANAEASELQEHGAAINRTDALKGVHVKDVIRQHNTKNGGTNLKNGKCSRPRPRSAVVYGTLGEHSYYRDIYEYNARQCYESNGAKSGKRRTSGVGTDDNDMFGDADDDEDEENDDDDELSESYYVSNDVLEKIRECGSSVTYYGGRVLQNTTLDPHNHSVGNCTNATNLPHSTMTLTRVRVKEFETCSACQPNKCPHSQQLKDKFQDVPTAGPQDKETAATLALRNENNDAYLGVKFKLIKSNSCSSRLELAGAEEEQLKRKEAFREEEEEEETEVVKDIVKRLEATGNKTGKLVGISSKATQKEVKILGNNKSTLTIKSQMPAKRDVRDSSASNEDLQVTVNNHIIVPVPAVTSTNTTRAQKSMPAKDVVGNTPKSMLAKDVAGNTPKSMVAKDVEGKKNSANLIVEAETQIEKTFQSSAMNIRLEPTTATTTATTQMGRDKCHSSSSSSSGGISIINNNNGNGTTKICRNKNVDLAFTMTKQQTHQLQQQQHSQPHSNTHTNTKSTGTITKDNRKNHTYQPTLQSTLEHTVLDNEKVMKNTLQKQTDREIGANVVVGGAIVGNASAIKTLTNDNLSTNSTSSNNALKNIDDTLSRSQATNTKKSIRNLEQPNDGPNNTKTSVRFADKPKSIIVPVEIHQRHNNINNNNIHGVETIKSFDDKSSNLSCCSSTTSMDKTFVRHYVANDKSLLERRKYDDIEFEEFEVYDPSKDVERLSAENNANHAQAHTHTQRISSVRDLSSLNDDAKFKSDTDLYDSLDVKL